MDTVLDPLLYRIELVHMGGLVKLLLKYGIVLSRNKSKCSSDFVTDDFRSTVIARWCGVRRVDHQSLHRSLEISTVESRAYC
jgi:hypothetical protein